MLLILISLFFQRIRHFKDRFKRQQGEHLYLPGSYITDGGEGPDNGPWTEWSAPSPCSRSCGGGVASQSRVCEFGYLCQGPTTRYFSCNTQVSIYIIIMTTLFPTTAKFSVKLF